MVTPNSIVNKKKIEKWLAKDDEEFYSSEEMKTMLKEEMVNYRAKNN